MRRTQSVVVPVGSSAGKPSASRAKIWRVTIVARRTAAEQRAELDGQRRKVDFDTYDVTVDELLRRVARKRIDIAPVYQRQFRWDRERQSRLIESVLLGIPVPPLFMATNTTEDVSSNWEVVDGLQRLLTLVNFAGDERTRSATHVSGSPLRLVELEKLTTFEGSAFESLPGDIRTTFEDRPLKVIVLNDKSDLQVRFDLFERLNTGGVTLTPHEIRQSVFRGDFIDMLGELSGRESFRTVVVLPEARWKDGTPEDYALRFFAFLERYKEFDHSVTDFLTSFTAAAYGVPDTERRSRRFNQTLDFLAKCFPDGLKGRTGVTPVNLFEGVAVGAALALRERARLRPTVNPSWIRSDELRRYVTAATNSRPRVTGRIEFCRDRFLEDHA
jgi:hypothetical protein